MPVDSSHDTSSTRAERLRRGGELLLSWGGFYLTGEYRPLAGLGQCLIRAELAADGEPRILLTWHVSSGRYSSDQEVVVPVPPGREDEAREAVRVLQAALSS